MLTDCMITLHSLIGSLDNWDDIVGGLCGGGDCGELRYQSRDAERADVD